METLDRAALERRRSMWRQWRDNGTLPEQPPAERAAAARRQRRTYWWADLDAEEEGRPPEQTRGPLGGGPFESAWRGSLRHSITKKPNPGTAVAA